MCVVYEVVSNSDFNIPTTNKEYIDIQMPWAFKEQSSKQMTQRKSFWLKYLIKHCESPSLSY